MPNCNWNGSSWNDIYSHICALPECNGKDCQDDAAVWNQTAFETLTNLEAMLEKGIFDVNETGTSDIKKHAEKNIGKKTTPLIFAIYQHKSYIVDLFIQYKVDVNLQDDSGMTPLIACCIYDYPECITLLLEKGADVNAQDSEGKTALMRAAEYGSTACFDILLPKSDIKIEDNEGNTVKNLISKDCETCFDKLAQSICSNTSIDKESEHLVNKEKVALLLKRIREKRKQNANLPQAIQSDRLSEKERAEKERVAEEERAYKLTLNAGGTKKRKYKLHKKKTSKKIRSLKNKQPKKRRSFKKINLHFLIRK